MYSATKAYLVSFSEALHGELIDSGVRVQALCPGFTRTEMHADAPRGWLADRIWMTPDAVVLRSLCDLKQDRVISVPGVGFRALYLLSRLLPRPVLHFTGRLIEKTRSRPAEPKEGFAGFAKRTYQSVDEVKADIRFMRERGGEIHEAMQLIDPTFRERLMLAVTQVNGCRYCAQYHAKLALEEGLGDDEVARLLDGSFEDAPPEQRTALLYARHWADQRGDPDPEARARLVEIYGEEKADAIEVLLQMIKMGNYLGNAWDYVLYRISGGRWGQGTSANSK
jgi:AhpD family alkylhydroperoxidase